MTVDLDGRTVLIGQSALHDIAGSEVVTYELARSFAANGARVIVVAYAISEEWRARVEANGTTVVHRFDDPALAEELDVHRPDIAWIHHGVIPEQLLRNPGRTRFVFHHMSSFQLQEFPHSPRAEAALASAIVFPSAEARDAHLASGLYAGVDEHIMTVFGNPAPDGFARDPSATHTADLRRLLIVSNHPPSEVEEAAAILAERGVEVVRLGGAIGSAHKRLVEPHDIHDVDALVSIGKTVQYALVAGVPVYIYDHFGGPGWLTEAEFETAGYGNFSGRGFPHRDAATIAEELMRGFASAAAEASAMSERHASEYLLSRALDRVLTALPEEPGHTPIETSELAATVLRGNLLNGLTNAVQARALAVADLTTRTALLRHEVGALSEQLSDMESGLAELAEEPGLGTEPAEDEPVSGA